MAEVFDGTGLFQSAHIANTMAGDAQVLRVNRTESPEFSMHNGFKSESLFEASVTLTVNQMYGKIEVLEVPRTIKEIKPEQDTFLRQSVPTFSYYYYSELLTGTQPNDEFLALMQFNVPKNIEMDHRITWEKAILKIPKRDRAFVDMSLYRIEQEWHDNNVTWKTNPPMGEKIVDSYMIPGDLDNVYFDLSEYFGEVVMNGAEDFGFYIKSNKGKVSMNASESNQPPILTVEYKDFTLMNLLDTVDFQSWVAFLYNNDSPEFEVSTYGANIPNNSPEFEMLLDKGPDKGFELFLHPHMDFEFGFGVSNEGATEYEFEYMISKVNHAFNMNLHQRSEKSFDYGMYQIKTVYQDFDYGMYQIRTSFREFEQMQGYSSESEFDMNLIIQKKPEIPFESDVTLYTFNYKGFDAIVTKQFKDIEFDSEAIIFHPIYNEFEAVLTKDIMEFEYSVVSISDCVFEYSMERGGETSSDFDMNLLLIKESDSPFQSMLGVTLDYEFEYSLEKSGSTENEFEMLLTKETSTIEFVLNKPGSSETVYDMDLLALKETEFDYSFVFYEDKNFECVLNYEAISEIDFFYMKGYASESDFDVSIAVYKETEFEAKVVYPLDKQFEMNLRQRSEKDFELDLLQVKEQTFELDLYFQREAKFELDLAFMSECGFEAKLGDQQMMSFESLLGNFIDKTFSMDIGHQSLSPEFEADRHPASYCNFEMLLEHNNFFGYAYEM